MLYYDIFNYPLKSNEVLQFLGTNSLTEDDVVYALNNLTENKFLFRFDEFYSIQPTERNILRRINGNIAAAKYLDIAKRQAGLISRFPFVRAVLASGSLAKGFMDENSDLDFFIITAPGRLWIARTLLVLYKRLFLFNSHKYFCVNYFVDENHLEIEEKNIFTATELATVIPLYGAKQYTSMLLENPWLKERFPNYVQRPTRGVPESTVTGFKKIIESILNTLFVNKLDAYCRKITRNRWKKLYEKEYSKADFEIAFKSKEYASKNHPQHFQRKIVNVYAEKLRTFKFSNLND